LAFWFPEEEVDAHHFETVSNLRAFTDFETAATWVIMKDQP
jgi:hypothetical protein